MNTSTLNTDTVCNNILDLAEKLANYGWSKRQTQGDSWAITQTVTMLRQIANDLHLARDGSMTTTAAGMKLLIIEDGDKEIALMIVPSVYDDMYALSQANNIFESSHIDREIGIPDIMHKGVVQYYLYRGAP